MLNNNEMIAVLGQRGTGKTTWMFRNLPSTPFVIVDPVYDVKFKSIPLKRIETIEEGFNLFKNGSPQRIYISPNLQTFDFFCKMILAKGNMTLIVDEVDHYANQWYIPDGLKKIVNVGRHRNVNLWTIARRPKNTHPIIRAQANRFIIFQMGLEDAKTLESYIGKEASDKTVTLKTEANGSEYIDYNFKTRSYTINRIVYVGVKQDAEESNSSG